MKRFTVIFVVMSSILGCKDGYIGDKHAMKYPPCTSIDKALNIRNDVYELILEDSTGSVDINDIIKLNKLHRLKLDLKLELDTFPSELVNLQYLDLIEINNSKISYIDYQIQHFSHLKILKINNSKITEFPIWLCTDWLELESLSLAGNRISQLPREIGNMHELYTLDLKNNRLTSLPFEIGELKKLIYLDLSNNKLTDIPNTMVWLYKELETINLKGNDIDSVRIKWLIYNLPYTDIISDYDFTAITNNLQN